MGEPEVIWRPVDYQESSGPFDERFRWHPSDLRLDAECLVLDIAELIENDDDARLAAGEAAVSAAALRAFVWLAGDDDLLALDWGHYAYRWSPRAEALVGTGWRVPVLPDGDYYAHMPPDLRWGTFAHPGQRTLTLWGDDLVRTLGAELLTWLPRHPQSRA